MCQGAVSNIGGGSAWHLPVGACNVFADVYITWKISLQVLRHWRAVQKDAADARLLHELQLMHQASLHQRRMFGLRSLYGWAEVAAASREEAAAQARKDATWDKIQQWLAEDTGRESSSEAILAPPFLQVVSDARPTLQQLMENLLAYADLHC